MSNFLFASILPHRPAWNVWPKTENAERSYEKARGKLETWKIVSLKQKERNATIDWREIKKIFLAVNYYALCLEEYMLYSNQFLFIFLQKDLDNVTTFSGYCRT